MSKKQCTVQGAVQVGDETATKITPDDNVEVCCVCSKSGVMLRCGNCKATKYCSKRCQKEHFSHHSKYCSAISDLAEFELKKLYNDHSVREQQVDGKTRTKMLKLIGEKPMLNCTLDNTDVEVLWDTGSMISLVDTKWVKKYFPNKELHSVQDFLENEVLQIRAANSTVITFEGVLLFEFSLRNDSKVVFLF